MDFHYQSSLGTQTPIPLERALHDITVAAFSYAQAHNLFLPDVTRLFVRLLPQTDKEAPLGVRLDQAIEKLDRARQLWASACSIYSNGSAVKSFPSNNNGEFLEAALDLLEI